MAFVPIVLSLLVLAAHFLRGGCLPFTLALLALLALLPLRRAWVPRFFQVVLTLGALEWGRTLVTLAMARGEQGEPYLRMVLILGAVALVTQGSALLFETDRLRRWYGTDGNEGGEAVRERGSG